MLTWFFSTEDGQIICPEQSVQLTPKASEVLACLIRHAGEIVSVDTVLEEVWPGVHVTPDLVREYISDLRAGLHDDARNPRYIETVRGKGFRLKGGIEPASQNMLHAEQRRVKEIRATIALLKPHVTGGDQLASLAETIASDIINDLARYHDIGVVARQSTFSGAEVSDLRAFARDVNAQYILESSVSGIEQTARLRFQLVDAESGRNLWAERFDRPTDNLIQAADEIVAQVVAALTGWHGELHRAEFKSVLRKRSEDLNAFEHFILGCDLELQFTPESLERALFHLDRATKLDPTFARAWLVYGLALQWANDVMPDQDATYLAQSARAFETAFTLAPGDPVTLALVALKIAREGGLERAKDVLARAEAQMMGDTDAMVCVATSTATLTPDAAHAMEIFDAALKANPTPPFWFPIAETRIAFLAGAYERCVTCARTAPPQISVLIFECLSWAMLGDAEACRLAHERLRTAYPHIGFAGFADAFPIADPVARARYDAAVEQVHALLQDTEQAWPALRDFSKA